MKYYQERKQLIHLMNSLCNKYVAKTYPINIEFGLAKNDNHFIERMYDRGIDKLVVSRLITHMIKYHMCEVIYYALTGVKRLEVEDSNFNMIGVSLSAKLIDSVTQIRICPRTLYVTRENRNRVLDENILQSIRIDDNEYNFKKAQNNIQQLDDIMQ